MDLEQAAEQAAECLRPMAVPGSRTLFS